MTVRIFAMHVIENLCQILSISFDILLLISSGGHIHLAFNLFILKQNVLEFNDIRKIKNLWYFSNRCITIFA